MTRRETIGVVCLLICLCACSQRPALPQVADDTAKSTTVRSDAGQAEDAASRPAVAAAETQATGERKAARTNSWKIATYNINWGDPDLASVAATIRRADADVVCLQETTRRSEPYLRRAFAKVYSHISFHGHRGEYEAERFGLLARVPVSKVTFLPPKHGLFGACLSELQLGGRAVQVINVHLEPILLQEAAGLLAAWSAMNAMEQTHLQEISRIWESRRRDVPHLIVGDFNSPSRFQAPSFLRENGLKDSFAEAHANPDAEVTWHWQMKSGEASLRIDYIFHSKEFRTVRSQVLRSDASDHYLLESEFQWQTERPAPTETQGEHAR